MYLIVVAGEPTSYRHHFPNVLRDPKTSGENIENLMVSMTVSV